MADASTHVNVIQSIEPHIFNITVNQKIVSTNFMFMTDNQYVLDINKKMNVFYTDLCCTFAYWALNMIYCFFK